VTVFIVPANADCLERFQLELTSADDAEAQACGCANAFTAFGLLLEQSLEAYAAVVELGGRVGAMFGVRPRTDGDGVQLWFHSTELFRMYPLAFVRHTRQTFDRIVERHRVVHGMIDPKNEAMIRLATWCGFQLDGVQQVGEFFFHPAVLRRG
jgi:hypothetical protein